MLLVKLIHINMDKIKRPKLYTLPDTLRRQSSAAAVLICPAWAVWYQVQTGAACPASGGVSCFVWSALLPVVCSPSGCAGAGVSTSGVYGESRGVGWSTPRVEKIQKRRFLGVVLQTTHPVFTKRNQSDCASLQIFKKIKKDPSPGLICAILDRKKGAL